MLVDCMTHTQIGLLIHSTPLIHSTLHGPPLGPPLGPRTPFILDLDRVPVGLIASVGEVNTVILALDAIQNLDVPEQILAETIPTEEIVRLLLTANEIGMRLTEIVPETSEAEEEFHLVLL